MLHIFLRKIRDERNTPEVTLLADCWMGILERSWQLASVITQIITHHSTLCLNLTPDLLHLHRQWRGEGHEGKQTSIYWAFLVCPALIFGTFLISLTPQRNSERSMSLPPIYKWGNWYWEVQGYNTKREATMAPKSMSFHYTNLIP